MRLWIRPELHRSVASMIIIYLEEYAAKLRKEGDKQATEVFEAAKTLKEAVRRQTE